MTTSTRENGLRQDTERTRERLGDTLQALAHKVDVSARVKDKARDTKEAAQGKAEEVKQQTQGKAKEIKQRVHTGTEALQARADEVTLQAQRLTHQALAKLPPPVAARMEPLTATARQRPLPTAAVAVGVLVGVLLILRRLLAGTGDDHAEDSA